MDIKFSLIQTSLVWENKNSNIQLFNEKLNTISNTSDVIVLPEMFTTGFSMNSKELAEGIKDNTAQWLIQKSKEKNACIVGSIITKQNQNFYNTLLFAQPNGNISSYNKRHLFRMAGEHNHYSSGITKSIIEYKQFKILPLICYDLRFPVWSRNKFDKTSPEKATYDILIYVANWPEARYYAWRQLLIARAIENQCYVVGVNRIGTDGTAKTYNGQSLAVNYKGEILADLKENDCIETISFNLEELYEFRKKFPAGIDADDFELK